MKVFQRENHLASFLIAFNNDVGTLVALKNKTLAKIAEEIFKKTNAEITEKLPDLLNVLNDSISEKRTFINLIKHLHDTANQLDCDQEAPLDLTPEERMTWEFINWKALLERIKNKQENLANIYEQMSADLETQKDSESKKKAQATIDAALKFLFRKEEYLKLVAEKTKDAKANKSGFALEDTKVLVHFENGHVDTMVKTLPGFLANVYQEAKGKQKVKEFFNNFLSKEGFCLEASMRSLEGFLFSLWS